MDTSNVVAAIAAAGAAVIAVGGAVLLVNVGILIWKQFIWRTLR